MTLQIREMVAEDLYGVREIEKESFTNPWSEHAYLTELENPISQLWVLEIQEEIIGMICYWMVLDEIHLLNIAVAKKHRGRGYAFLLMRKMLRHGQDADSRSVLLEVRENNENAIRLYKGLGFQMVGRVANYYPEDKQDALVMRKELL